MSPYGLVANQWSPFQLSHNRFYHGLLCAVGDDLKR
jgi:hypothetical protein